MSSLSSVTPFNLAFVGEAVFGTAADEKPILATDGLRSCVGFAGRSDVQKIGFLAHFMGPAQVDQFFSLAPTYLAQFLSDSKEPLVFDCDLIGGSQKTYASAAIIERIKAGIESAPPSLKFRIVYEEPPTKGIVLKSLALDLRNGQRGSYESENDPSPRQRIEDEIARLVSMDLFERLVIRT